MYYEGDVKNHFINLKLCSTIHLSHNQIRAHRVAETNSRLKTVVLFRGGTPEDAAIELNYIWANFHHDVDPRIVERFAGESDLILNSPAPETDMADDVDSLVEEVESTTSGLLEIDSQHQQAYDMRQAGETYVKIAEEFDVSESTVRNWVKDVQEIIDGVNKDDE